MKARHLKNAGLSLFDGLAAAGAGLSDLSGEHGRRILPGSWTHGSDNRRIMTGTATSDIPEFLQSLNPQQRSAVMHGDAPLLIIAGSRDGKNNHAGASSRLADCFRAPILHAFCC
jgi:hypothetical protein